MIKVCCRVFIIIFLQYISFSGMTNRKDMIDDALLRPGRLEVQVEISLPNEEGRFQILNIHTSRMKAFKKIDTDVDMKVCNVKIKKQSK